MAIRFNWFKTFWQILMAVWLVISMLGMIAAPAGAALQSESQVDTGVSAAAAAGQILQFTSGGQVLGFNRQGTYIVSPSHMLKTSFVDANPVDPQSEAAGAADNTGAAAPMGKVSYPNLWDGVNLVYEAKEGLVVKSTYYIDGNKTEVALKSIRLSYNRPVSLDEQGNLVVAFETGNLVEKAPVAWQEVEGTKRPVAASYKLASSAEVSFTLGDFIPGIPVVMDPDTTWNTFLGGPSSDSGYGIAVDSSGNVYVTGYSYSTWGNPVRAYTSGVVAFAAKLDGSGVLQWNTFLGEAGSDYGNGIAVDSSGSVYVIGYSADTWGNPIRAYTSGFDAFTAKLDSSGALQWNTFLGGTGDDYGYGIAVDSSSNVYVSGYSQTTWGNPLREYSENGDAFVANLNSRGTLQWNTFLGGTGSDSGYGIAVDSSGNVYVTGTSSAAWGSPVNAYSRNGDAFAAKLNSGGALQWNTFLGGTGSDSGGGVAVDSSGNVYVTGFSDIAWGNPLRAYTSETFDVFAARLDSSGALQWNTFLGGTGSDSCGGIAMDSSGNVYITGTSTAAWGNPVRAYTSGVDAFAARLDSSGVLLWNTFLGGTNQDYGNSIVVDSKGKVYVAGDSTADWGSPVRAYSGNYDTFTAKLDSNGRLEYPAVVSVTLQGGGRPDAGWVVPLTVKFFTPGADVLTATPLYTFNLTTAKSGSFAVAQASGAVPGTYDISVITPHCLTNVKTGVVGTSPSTAVYLGTLLEGNANDDNIINITDFGLLAASYGKSADDINYDARADFDCSGIINISDFGLLAANYGKSAPVEVP